MSLAHKGKVLSEEHREKIRQSLLERSRLKQARTYLAKQ